MKSKQHTLSDAQMDEIRDQTIDHTPPSIVEAIAIQLHTAREARRRIETEGSVVRDVKGSVVKHPAIQIEADAIKLYTALLGKWS